jgi:hypothetical protein
MLFQLVTNLFLLFFIISLAYFHQYGKLELVIKVFDFDLFFSEGAQVPII